MATNLSVVFSAVDNISKALKGMAKEVNNANNSFEEIAKKADEAFDRCSDGAEETEQSLQDLAQNIADGFLESFQQVAEEANLSEEELRAAYGELPDFFRGVADGLESEMAGVGDATEETKEDVEELGEEFENTGKKGKKSGEDMKNAMSSLESFMAAAGVVAALKGIAGAFSECAKQAEVTETAFAKLETIAGSSPMEGLKADIMELSAETGIATAALADVAYNAISAGTAVEDSVKMAATASKLATAGFTDTSSALAVLTTATNAYGEAAGTATQISDSLIMVQNLGVTTVAELSANMGKAIATASAYNVSLDNLESSYISVTKAGINTAEGTTYISSMLKELGKEGSSVSDVLVEQTGKSFSQLMDSGYSLADVLGILYESCNEDATALMNLWGSAEAGKAANAIISQGLEQFNDNLKTLQASAGATESAYKTMADTTEFAHNKMENSFANLKTAVGNNLNPMLEVFYSATTGVVEFMTLVTEKAPLLTNLITAVAVGVGVLAVAVTGYTVVTKIATAAEAGWTAMLSTQAGALTLKLGLIGAITAAVGILAVSILSAKEEEVEMTAATDDMNDRMATLTNQYNKACDTFGETSVQAQILAGEMADLQTEISNNSMTMEEFHDHVNNLIESHDAIIDRFTQVQTESEKNREATAKLVGRLRDLQEATDKSSKSEGEMEAILKRLNQLYPELGLNINDVNSNLDLLTKRIEAVAGSTMRAEAEAAEKAITDLLEEQDALLEAQKNAKWNLDRAWQEYRDQNWLQGGWNELWDSGATKKTKEMQAEYDRITAAVNENAAALEEAQRIVNDYADTLSGRSEEALSAANAVDAAITIYMEDVEKLAKDYQAAYEAALTSIEGQWKLWETAGEVAEASILDIGKAMASQIDYWKKYNETLEALHNRNIEGLDDLVASMADGSTESASYLRAMAESSDLDLMLMVAGYQDLRDAQNKTADNMAELETDYEKRLAALEENFKTTIDNMNMESEAYTAATETIQGYINGIKDMQDQAVAQARAVAQAALRELELTPEPETPSLPEVTNPEVPINGPTWTAGPDPSWTLIEPDSGGGGGGHKFAKGTTDSPSVYLAGEEGPEMIISGGHDTVFPAGETDKIIRAVTDESSRGTGDYSYSRSEHSESIISNKTITLNITGSGSMQIDRSTDKESVWENIKDNIKDAIMGILSDEIYEGSEGAYEF